MGHEQHRGAGFLADAQQQVVHLQPGQLVERAERLVHQQQVRLMDEGAAQGDALLHAAGELMRPGVVEGRKTDQRQELAGARPRRLVVAPEDLHREQHIVDHRAPRHQARRLKHEAVVAERTGDLTPADGHRARGLGDQPGDDAQQRGLAAAGRPEQRNQLTALEAEARIVERDDRLRRARAELADRKHLAHVFDCSERHQPVSRDLIAAAARSPIGAEIASSGPHPEEHPRQSADASRRMAKDKSIRLGPSFETLAALAPQDEGRKGSRALRARRRAKALVCHVKYLMISLASIDAGMRGEPEWRNSNCR